MPARPRCPIPARGWWRRGGRAGGRGGGARPEWGGVRAGARPVALAREPPKRFESIVPLPLRDAPAWLAADPNHVRGEFVVIVHPPAAAAAMGATEATLA